MRAEVNYHAQKVDLYRIFKNDKSKFQFFRKLTIAPEQRFKQFRKKVLNQNWRGGFRLRTCCDSITFDV